MLKISKKSREKQFKTIGDHQEFLNRITKTLYYGKLPPTERLSLPVTELAAELFSEAQNGRSLERLHCNDAAKISRNACVSPCSLILAMLYLEQLKACNPEYLQRIAPSELFLVSLMVSSKFLHDDGEEDEVFIDEWASSGGISVKHLIQLEKEFLNGINWEVFVHEHMFWKKLGEIETTIAKKEGGDRGWFTYTELQYLMSSIDVYNLIQCISAVMSVLTVTYTLGILTILGSMFIVSTIPGNSLQNNNVYIETESYLNIDDGSAKHFDNFNDTSDTDIASNIIGNNLDSTSNIYKKHLDAADVLKTGIILASIKTAQSTKRNVRPRFDVQLNDTTVSKTTEAYAPWAWWSSSTMDWLTKTSKMIERFDLLPNFKHFVYDQYIEMSIANWKIINLEDQIHKATKVRIQEQMERSWHIEWTDTLKNMLWRHKILNY
ncbi:hypothetical protein ILUMI_23796 [Ignelater luminosus]|uniref:Protein CNPPD1 n=1 Tax=Ignelater luminosus TaxID=2038154 RepID=A0A8K0G199_IGNLU|nr:hypothetical protein ILUMI_23796 [Ignelater luminosus]